MPQYKVEYREAPHGAPLQSNFLTAIDDVNAELAVKREFTLMQANLGARQYQIFDDASVVVAAHRSADQATPDR
jgi:hypothetical protein